MSKDRIQFENRNVRFLHIYENIQVKFTDVFEHDNHATMPLCADGTYPLKVWILGSGQKEKKKQYFCSFELKLRKKPVKIPSYPNILVFDLFYGELLCKF